MSDSLGARNTLPSRLSATQPPPVAEDDQLPRGGGAQWTRKQHRHAGMPDARRTPGSSGSTSGRAAPGGRCTSPCTRTCRASACGQGRTNGVAATPN
eukprot:5104283-Alexandrium_andersonii.AAC.1